MDNAVKIFSFIFLLIVLSAAGRSSNSTTNASQDDLQILVTMVRSEHSKDSNSTTTTLTVSGDTIVYRQRRSGAHSSQSKPIERDFKLTNEDKGELVRLLNEKKLLVTKSISRSLETTGPRSYVSLSFSIQLKLNGKRRLISIDGPMRSTAIKNDPLYRDSLVLINELYLIVHRTDPRLRFDEFVDDTGDE